MIERIATCPWCLYVTDAITAVDDGPGPDVGDVSVCAQCAVPSIVDDTAIGGLRKPTRREHEAIAQDPLALAAIATILNAKGRLA